MTNRGDTRRLCTPLSDWPQVDRVAWVTAQQPSDPLDPSQGAALKWRVSTRRQIESGYGRWIGWLEESGQLDHEDEPGRRATHERVKAYRDMLNNAGCADNTIAGRLQQLCNALRIVAPGYNWTWIHKASSRLYSRAVPVRDFDSRMQPAEDILTLGLDLMHAADFDRFRKPCERALMYRDGLMLTLLVSRPLRLGNLAEIVIGQHLQKSGDRWRLFFNESETKQARRLEFHWPDDTVEALERYLAVHRAQLLTALVSHQQPARTLWVSQRGTAMSKAAVAFQLMDRTKEEFGTAINPHTFRRIANTTIATANPEDAEDTLHVLGHSSIATSERYYNRARMVSAGHSLHGAIANLRKGKK